MSNDFYNVDEFESKLENLQDQYEEREYEYRYFLEKTTDKEHQMHKIKSKIKRLYLEHFFYEKFETEHVDYTFNKKTSVKEIKDSIYSSPLTFSVLKNVFRVNINKDIYLMDIIVCKPNIKIFTQCRNIDINTVEMVDNIGDRDFWSHPRTIPTLTELKQYVNTSLDYHSYPSNLQYFTSTIKDAAISSNINKKSIQQLIFLNSDVFLCTSKHKDERNFSYLYRKEEFYVAGIRLSKML